MEGIGVTGIMVRIVGAGVRAIGVLDGIGVIGRLVGDGVDGRLVGLVVGIAEVGVTVGNIVGRGGAVGPGFIVVGLRSTLTTDSSNGPVSWKPATVLCISI